MEDTFFQEYIALLILTRRLGESIFIGDDVKVTVLGVGARQVKLGIDAPSEITVHREEIYKIDKEISERIAKKNLAP